MKNFAKSCGQASVFLGNKKMNLFCELIYSVEILVVKFSRVGLEGSDIGTLLDDLKTKIQSKWVKDFTALVFVG